MTEETESPWRKLAFALAASVFAARGYSGELVSTRLRNIDWSLAECDELPDDLVLFAHSLNNIAPYVNGAQPL